MDKIGKTENQWHDSKNPVFDIAHIYDHAHADYQKSKAAKIKDEKASSLRNIMLNSFTSEDLKNLKNNKLANVPIKMDCLLTFAHMLDFADEIYEMTSFNTLQDQLSNFASSPFPIATSADEVVQFKKIEALCDEYRELNYSNVTDDVYKQSAMATMLQKLELTDAELKKQLKLKLSESAINKSKPTFDELFTAFKKGYSIYTIMHAEKSIDPIAVANKIDGRRDNTVKNYICLRKGNCPLANHRNHNISNCHTLKSIIKFMQAQLLFLQANAKTGTTSTKPKKLFVKKNFANIPEITMQDLEQMQTDDVLAYVSEVNNIKMPQENISALLPALAAFDSHTKLSSNSDDDDNDIANAYAMEYASSDDEKA